MTVTDGLNEQAPAAPTGSGESASIVIATPASSDELRAVLDSANHSYTHCRIADIAATARSTGCGVVILPDSTDCDGVSLACQVMRALPHTRVALVAAVGSVERAVAATKLGADYMACPLNADAVLDAMAVGIDRGRRAAADRARVDELLIGTSPAMSELKSDIRIVADCAGPVLIHGESGTGKDLVARSLHALSNRADGPFIAVNCAAFPDSLIDGELFGHERGAFTGATTQRKGRFESADGGVLFLDEIGEMPMAAQAKLLRVLQDGTFQRLGSSTTQRADVRILSATNRDLEDRVANGQFREDLYFRLRMFSLQVPRLVEREGDLPVLIQHFCRKYSEQPDAVAHISPSVWGVLAARTFRGNVRELEHIIRHALAFSKGQEIQLRHLPPELRGPRQPPQQQQQQLQQRAPSHPEVGPLSAALTTFEREYLRHALRQTEGNRAQAARLLGISRKSLWAKLKRLQTPACEDHAEASL